MVELEKQKISKIFKEYLDIFYTQPLSGEKYKVVSNKINLSLPLQAFRLTSMEEIRQVGQYYLLAFHKRLYWQCYNVYDFVNLYFVNDPPMLHVVNNFPVIVIYQTGNEMGGKKLDPMIDNLVNQVIETRLMLPGAKTLFLTLAGQRSLKFPIEVMWGDVGKFEIT